MHHSQVLEAIMPINAEVLLVQWFVLVVQIAPVLYATHLLNASGKPASFLMVIEFVFPSHCPSN